MCKSCTLRLASQSTESGRTCPRPKRRIRRPGPLWRWAALALPLLAASGALAQRPARSDLHIPQGRQANFTAYLNDGAGYRWDIQYYLNIGQGTNYIYSGGVYCRIGGSNVSSNGRGWMNAAGDEIEIGPYNRNNCQIYRRCKVYRDQGLARWLDIFVNTTGSAQTIPVEIYTSVNGSVSQIISSSGAGSYSQKDWAFITEHQQGRPSLLHIVSGPRSKVRPTVTAEGSSIRVCYSVTVPARGTVVLCYFESQGHTTEELKRSMKKFRASEALKDLSPAVRKLIVNFRMGEDLEDVELERSGTSDVVILKNDDPVFGRITNEGFVLEAFYGRLTLPAQQVVGFAYVPGQEELVRAVLVGGQVISGKLQEGLLHFALPTGGDLKIPFSRIKQCSYRISKERPAEWSMIDPLLLLRTGDRLAFDPELLKCTFKTRHGTVPLDSKQLLEVRLHQGGHGVHRAVFLNGSKLAGLLGPEQIILPLKLGPKLNISRDMVLGIRFAAETKEDPDLACARLSNEDELFGRLSDEAYVVVTDFGTVNVKPKNVAAMSFDEADPTRIAITLWDGSTLRGHIQQEALHFEIEPGPVLDLHVGQIVGLTSPRALPPDDVVKRVEKYVAMLSAASYQDREEAQRLLVEMGGKIVPLLKKYLTDADPEIRQRITVILERIGSEAPGGSAGNPLPAAFGQPGGKVGLLMR